MLRRMRCQGLSGLAWVATLLLPATAVAARPRAPVPPTLEIEVLDPNADPQGNPAIELRKPERAPCCGLPCERCGRPSRDQYEVDIPPVVIVHRYYYTGDRSFQGPMLPGGPSIVVVNHPKTGERCYIPVQMLPGAPIVRYSGSGIEYDYGPNGITVKFGPFSGRPKVVYRNRVPCGRQVKNALNEAGKCAGGMIEEIRLPELAGMTAEGTKNLAINARNGLEDAGERLLAPAISFIQATPIGSLLRSNPEEQAMRQRDREVRAAARERLRSEAFFPSLR